MFENGHNMIPLAAILSIGEKVLDKFVPDPEAKAKAIFELKKMEQDGRLAELNADNIEAQELTKRAEADMHPDPELHFVGNDQVRDGFALWYGKRPNRN
jgi:hypothetical protein